MNRALAFFVFFVPLLVAVAPGRVRASAPAPAAFAIIIGVNRSVDRDLPTLRYADDDAARYFDLFRLLGARTYLLTRPDQNTRQLHAQATAEAYPPRDAALKQVITLLRRDIQQARARQLRTILYVIYAGHGNEQDGRGYITLEDARLTGERIQAEIVRALPADRVHLIVDACYSYYLAYSRGPGGTRRALSGFSRLKRTFSDDRIGLLLSSSSARESHEWEGFQAGVFSHEVRSGLYGAADADGDGQVTYREIAAFVAQANRAIPNERFRPQVFARSPRREPVLLDLRRLEHKTLAIDGAHHGHYYLEDVRGVRLADFHNGARQALTLLRPQGHGPLFLRRPDGQEEYTIPIQEPHLELAALTPSPPMAAQRGAAHHAFRQLFSLPFDKAVVQGYVFNAEETVHQGTPAPRRTAFPWRPVVTYGAAGLAAVGLAGGIACTFAARGARGDLLADASQEEVASQNDTIRAYNTAAVVLYSLAGTAALVSITALLWPRGARTAPALSFSVEGGTFAVHGGGTF